MPMPESLGLLLVIFTISLYGLMKGADWLIEGASGIARRYGVSELVIGLTVVAFGTSLPELVVSVDASLKGNISLAYSNVLGSNLANILLVLGCTAIARPIHTPTEARRDLPFFALLVITFATLVTFGVYPFPAPLEGHLFRFDGIVLILFFGAFIWRILRQKPQAINELAEEESHHLDHLSVSRLGLVVLAGLVLVILGGDYTVKSAVGIAAQLGVSESTIGLTIVAVGTSLPELVASLVAAGKQKSDLAVGNILGSNLMNLALVLGCALILRPLSLNAFDFIDMIAHTIISLIFLGLLLRKGAKPQLSRHIGSIFVIIYIAYMTFIGYRAR
jgi:cation:H+ antiporter